MVKRMMANFYGHEILVVNTWFSGARLYINGECRAESGAVFVLNWKQALLTAEFDDDGELHIVEVFFRAIFMVEIKICVDGQQIGGEVF
jgi:hypothetical protein